MGPTNTFEGPNGMSCIDYCLVPDDMRDRVVKCSVSDNSALDTSDHRAVSMTLRMSALRSFVVSGTISPKIRRWDKCTDKEIFEKYTLLHQESLDSIISSLSKESIVPEDLDSAIDAVVKAMKDAAVTIPVSSFRRHIRPYWNEELSSIKKVKVEKYYLWVRAGRPREASDNFRIEYKDSKMAFNKTLHALSRAYENQEIAEAVKMAETDRNQFWRLVKRSRSVGGSCTTAIRDKNKKVVYECDEVLRVWKTHFQELCTPKNESTFDEEHFNNVNSEVKFYNSMTDGDKFTDTPFSESEVAKAISKLNMKKAPGYDGISTEHIKHGGSVLVLFLTLLYNLILLLEYIPVNLRRGTQIPLFKGKHMCYLDTNNYGGITLLSNFNKIFEVLLWGRLEKWWWESGCISMLQGACRKRQSCLHTALLLQETISEALETNKNVFVSYFDVSKAFDGVWTNDLFIKMYEMGITGKIWRVLFRAYDDIKCRVRVGGNVSGWYNMLCGIHQGGFLSLFNYTAFINALLVSLETSGLCCSIMGISSSPGGYADDIATACLSKTRSDRVHDIVYEYGRKWQFSFNAKKSSVLVYGEDLKTYQKSHDLRQFKLGPDRVNERRVYDHVGVKNCVDQENEICVKEKIEKGRKALNASSGIGIRKNGISIAAANLIYWTIVIPILTFGSELWILTDKDGENLNMFQRYAGRRIQHFPARFPNCSSSYGFGWVRITTYICVKKLLYYDNDG